MPLAFTLEPGHDGSAGLLDRKRAAGHVPHPRGAEYAVLHHAARGHCQLVGDAASGAELTSLVRQASRKPVGDAEIAGEADQAVGNGLLGFQDLGGLVVGVAASSPAAVEDESAAIGGPGDVECGGDGASAMDDSDGGGEDRKAVQEVGRAVEGVEDPECVGGWFL